MILCSSCRHLQNQSATVLVPSCLNYKQNWLLKRIYIITKFRKQNIFKTSYFSTCVGSLFAMVQKCRMVPLPMKDPHPCWEKENCTGPSFTTMQKCSMLPLWTSALCPYCEWSCMGFRFTMKWKFRNPGEPETHAHIVNKKPVWAKHNRLLKICFLSRVPSQQGHTGVHALFVGMQPTILVCAWPTRTTF